MSELELNPEADDQKTLAQVIDYYHRVLKETPDALEFLRKRGMVTSEALEQFRIGYANRTLGLKLPGKHLKSGREIRKRLEALNIFRRCSGGRGMGKKSPRVRVAGAFHGSRRMNHALRQPDRDYPQKRRGPSFTRTKELGPVGCSLTDGYQAETLWEAPCRFTPQPPGCPPWPDATRKGHTVLATTYRPRVRNHPTRRSRSRWVRSSA